MSHQKFSPCPSEAISIDIYFDISYPPPVAEDEPELLRPLHRLHCKEHTLASWDRDRQGMRLLIGHGLVWQRMGKRRKKKRSWI